MSTSEKHSFCRNCPANCGMILEVADNRIVKHRADKENGFSEGFICIKGDYAVDFHNGIEPRLVKCLERLGDDFAPVDTASVAEKVADRLSAIVKEHGPRSVALFYGTCAYQKALTIPIAKDFMAKLGSPNLFSTMTIDQSAHWVTDGRMGIFATGIPRLEDADTVVLVGTNPVLSHGSVFMSMPNNNQLRAIKEFRARGGRLVVIDPRRTETASKADIHVQPLPGKDGVIAAGLIRIMLDKGWHDPQFCDRYVTNLDALRRAVEPFTPDVVASMAGIPAEQLFEVAEALKAPARISVGFGTGMTMSPQPNTTAHLMRALNSICGGYARAGDTVRNPGVLVKKATVENVIPPSRSWESGPKLSSGHGRLYGEFPTTRLPHEIMQEGENRIRALIVVGGNPMSAIGNPDFVREAFSRLDLLVVIDPRMTDTARLADFVIAPPLQFEVHDFSSFADFTSSEPFLQYSLPAITPPPGTVEEWQFFNSVANRMGFTLNMKPFAFSNDASTGPTGLPLDPGVEWTTEQLIDWNMQRAGLSCEILSRHPHGLKVDIPLPMITAPETDDGARLDLCPEDVAQEVTNFLATRAPDGGYLLITRRVMDTMNSAYRQSPRVLRRHPHNSLYVNPEDMAADGISAGDVVMLNGRNGRIRAHVKADATMRRGVVSMTHCWGSIDDGGEADGNVNRLVSIDTNAVANIDAMPQHSALPVTISRCEDEGRDADADMKIPAWRGK
nr:molybdopterin-dependent oxidoreductase [Sphingomonas sp. CDS-1]